MLKTLLWGGEILEDWKIRIAVLWVILMGVATSDSNWGNWLEIALFWWVPLILSLSLLSLNQKDSINRWACIIAGIFFAGSTVIGSGAVLMAGMVGLSLMHVSEVVVSALIVWYAWKSKPKA